METRFRLKRGDFEIELAGEQAWVDTQLAAHLARWEGLAPETPAPEPEFPRVRPDFRPRVNVTLADFMVQKQATAPADMLIVAVYYMEKYLQQETFTIDALQARLAELPAWACQDANAVMEEALVRGHVEMLRDARACITYKGQNYVREGLT